MTWPPAPPATQLYRDTLHWSIQVMDGDDPDLGFTASLLAHALKYEGLSDKQARYADRIVDRLTALYRRGHLASQIDSAGDGQPEGLADAQIAGHA